MTGRKINRYSPELCIYVEITMNANIDGIIVLRHTLILFTAEAAVSFGYNNTSTPVMIIPAALKYTALDLMNPKPLSSFYA